MFYTQFDTNIWDFEEKSESKNVSNRPIVPLLFPSVFPTFLSSGLAPPLRASSVDKNHCVKHSCTCLSAVLGQHSQANVQICSPLQLLEPSWLWPISQCCRKIAYEDLPHRTPLPSIARVVALHFIQDNRKHKGQESCVSPRMSIHAPLPFCGIVCNQP